MVFFKQHILFGHFKRNTKSNKNILPFRQKILAHAKKIAQCCLILSTIFYFLILQYVRKMLKKYLILNEISQFVFLKYVRKMIVKILDLKT